MLQENLPIQEVLLKRIQSLLQIQEATIQVLLLVVIAVGLIHQALLLQEVHQHHQDLLQGALLEEINF